MACHPPCLPADASLPLPLTTHRCPGTYLPFPFPATLLTPPAPPGAPLASPLSSCTTRRTKNKSGGKDTMPALLMGESGLKGST